MIGHWYRGRPVEAVVYTVENILDVQAFVAEPGRITPTDYFDDPEKTPRDAHPHDLVLYTINGPVIVSPGDYVICSGKGELDACKPDQFVETYEEIVQ